MYINWMILWRTCNLGHLKGEKKKKENYQNQLMCTKKTTPLIWWSLPSVCILATFSKRGWRRSKRNVFVEYGLCARHWCYLTYSSLNLWIIYMVAFPFYRQEDWGSVRLSNLVESISRTVWLQPCASCSLASLFYQTLLYGTSLI